MSICPRGYASAKKYYYPFPSEQAMMYARDVCSGKVSDWTGIKKASPAYHNYIKPKLIKDINGFNRRHAEQWVNVCTKQPCGPEAVSDKRTCRPSVRLDANTTLTVNQMSDKLIDDLCRNYRPDYLDIGALVNKLQRNGLHPVSQTLHSGQSIGIIDKYGQYHISRPSKPLPELDIVEFTK